jgi:hypothetical protein
MFERNPLRSALMVMEWNHITDHDLERYYLGMIKDETELAPLEEHILACGWCAERAEQTQDYVDAIRVAALDLVDLKKTASADWFQEPAKQFDEATGLGSSSQNRLFTLVLRPCNELLKSPNQTNPCLPFVSAVKDV